MCILVEVDTFGPTSYKARLIVSPWLKTLSRSTLFAEAGRKDLMAITSVCCPCQAKTAITDGGNHGRGWRNQGKGP